ncbi:MAG TPA: 3-isopropylmalate dehydrogenase [Armatimonadota bacterium]|jgi:3-isopropylmalate dehydrogenase
MNKKIAILAGDGIGAEVVGEARRTLDAVAARFGHAFAFEEALVGWAAFDATGSALPDETVKVCRDSDAIFFGAVGDPARDSTVPPAQRPEVVALLTLRKGLYANLRPASIDAELAGLSVLKPEVVGKGVDILIVRELTGGLYYGRPKGREGDSAVDTMAYSAPEVERVARVAFEAARRRKSKLTSVDKANILACSQLWREVVIDVSKEYPDVALDHMYVDNCAMQLIRNPAQFDTIVTENTFGDILSDEASMLVGSLGMLPSASLGDGSLPAFYEPIHGSAPDIAGKGIANPIAAIRSAAMMLRYSFGLNEEADVVDAAVSSVLRQGLRTADIMQPGKTLASTSRIGAAVSAAIAEG